MTLNLSLDLKEKKQHQTLIEKSLPKKMNMRLPLNLPLPKPLVKI